MNMRWPIVTSGFLIIAAISCAKLAQNKESSAWQDSKTWSNVQVSQGEDPHAMGIEIELWQHDRELVGYMWEYVGPAADPPAGKLASIRIDEKDGKFSFMSKLSVGVVWDEGSRSYVPSRDTYSFEGVLREESITGSLQRKQILPNGKEVTESEAITLKRTPDDAQQANKSYEEWLKANEEILQLRGPKF